MKFSYEWLRDLVDLDVPAQEAADKLTFAGLAVEYVDEVDGDHVFDIDVTTNRPDCMNHLGIARELSVLFDRPLRHPDYEAAEEPTPEGKTAHDLVQVTLEDERCPRYVGRVIRGIRVGPSPDWLVRRLEAIGSRSINNVVDVTNYVLWELGQPLHAFDLHKVRGAEIRVRMAREGEELTTLDGERRKLSPEILMICDGEGVTALGGIMGGLDSEVTEETVDVLLESAHFDRTTVRRGAKWLGMHTDASHRFERGTDPLRCHVAATRAAQLIAELAGGTVVEGTVDARHDDSQAWRLEGRLDLARLNAFVGIDLEAERVERWMTGLGFEMRPHGEAAWQATVPTWRYYDFHQVDPRGAVYEQDLFEEVIRIHGFENIPATLPRFEGIDALPSAEEIQQRQVRAALTASGYAEAINFAFQSPAEAAGYAALGGRGEVLELANPLSERYSVLRRSLLPGLVESAAFNQRRGLPAVRLFELGRVFSEIEGERFPEEIEAVAAICGGTLGTPWDRQAELDFFDLKGVMEGAAATLGARLDAEPAEFPGLVPGASARLLLDGEEAGYIGQVDEEGPYPLFAAELRVDRFQATGAAREVRVPSRYPGVAVDLTLTHPLSVSRAELDAAVEELAPPDLVESFFKDRYLGQGVPEGAVNTTLSFFYNAPDRSLTQEEVNERHQALAAELESRYGWRG